MATVLAVQTQESEAFKNAEDFFDLQQVVHGHSWRPDMTAWASEAVLEGEQPFTYLIRQNENADGYVLSFVRPSGEIKHDEFGIINGRLGIFLNGAPDHCGPLGKVLLDMMGCAKGEETPLWL